MNNSKYVFAQLTVFLDRNHFNYLVRKYGGNKYVKHFTCWNQLLAMMFGQLSNRESLRDLVVAIEAHRSKCYHLGFGKNVSKTSLARANQTRDFHIFEEFAYYLVGEARRKRATDIFKLDGNVYAFDSTTVSLCLEVFWWAKFSKYKGGIKIHTLYDLETQIPAFFHISTASVYDSKVMKEIPIESGAYYIFDRGYNNFKELYRIHCTGSFFVVRAKSNLQYKCIKWKRRLPDGILTDAEIELTFSDSRKRYPEHLRLVRFFDEEQSREFMFLSNVSSSGSSSTSKSRGSGALPRTLSGYKSTPPSAPTVLLPSYSTICIWTEAPMRSCKSSACLLQTPRLSKISSTKLYSKMTKNVLALTSQLCLIILINNTSQF